MVPDSLPVLLDSLILKLNKVLMIEHIDESIIHSAILRMEYAFCYYTIEGQIGQQWLALICECTGNCYVLVTAMYW